MIRETKKALNPTASTVTCDGYYPQVKVLKDLCHELSVSIQPNTKEHKTKEHKKIDRVFRRMCQDLSRLGRKTLSTTKNLSELQNHLDLYTDYHNVRQAS